MPTVVYDGPGGREAAQIKGRLKRNIPVAHRLPNVGESHLTTKWQ